MSIAVFIRVCPRTLILSHINSVHIFTHSFFEIIFYYSPIYSEVSKVVSSLEAFRLKVLRISRVHMRAV